MGCGSPVETSAEQKHRPSRMARMRVSCGDLCEAEAPTEPDGENAGLLWRPLRSRSTDRGGRRESSPSAPATYKSSEILEFMRFQNFFIFKFHCYCFVYFVIKSVIWLSTSVSNFTDSYLLFNYCFTSDVAAPPNSK